MLPRQPLRFVLADDPGAGKTIMAGLLVRELLMRSDARRVLIMAPGALTEQWQDELLEKFGVQFEIFSREKQEQSASGGFFQDQDLLICRLDQLSRNEEYQDKLRKTHWDLIIVDEGHKLSANYFGSKVNKTKRFQLGELLGSIARHFLLMTATPHNGKEKDFHIWLPLRSRRALDAAQSGGPRRCLRGVVPTLLPGHARRRGGLRGTEIRTRRHL
nr:DEAD/DEAH box helicase [Aquisalimonas sp.]